ncbi:zinc ribbon domain-containing protein [Tundrisphaera sp. TA3]|uniref:zinc ribbon domain-containing protein n=1 Tax=Tundrisphaera sp. TA3 TaxID=3435775 RepID=UPI003EB9BC43
MPSTAANLRELHQLHQRAKALRDRLNSGPKTLATRQANLAVRQKAVEDARKALQDEKVNVKKCEHNLQAQQSRVDDFTVKLNTVKKNEEYKAITNQIANDRKVMEKTEGEILEAMERVDEKAAALKALELELKKFSDEVDAFKAQLESGTEAQRVQLAELENAIVEAEAIIPEDQRDRYRRTVKQRGADALSEVDGSACTGCFTTVTAQGMNELINGHNLMFCMTCGRILYLAEEDQANTRRTVR